MPNKPNMETMSVKDLQNAATAKRHAENLRGLLEEGETDIRAGRTRPMEEFLDEFSRANKIPGRNCEKS